MNNGRTVASGLVAFGAALARLGVPSTTDALVVAAAAVDAVDAGDREAVYWALHCSLLTERAQEPAFDVVFDSFWTGAPLPPARPGLEAAGSEPRTAGSESPAPDTLPISPDSSLEVAGADAAAEAEDDPEGEADAGGASRSSREALRRIDIRDLGPEELREAEQAIARLGRRLPRRMARRYRAGAHAGAIDTRATLRRSMRTEAHPLELAWRRRRQGPRSLIFLIDVSGSMEPYARPLVAFARGARLASKRVEVFTFGTRLTRLTAALERRHLDDALEAASSAIPDWAGGTRIGPSLERFNREWGRRGTARGAAVVIVSDGWETDDVSTLSRAMADLRSMAHSVIWVNPLAGDPDYEPLAAGMATALPYVDIFLPGQSLADLEELAQSLEGLPATRTGRRSPLASRVSPRPKVMQV